MSRNIFMEANNQSSNNIFNNNNQSNNNNYNRNQTNNIFTNGNNQGNNIFTQNNNNNNNNNSSNNSSNNIFNRGNSSNNPFNNNNQGNNIFNNQNNNRNMNNNQGNNNNIFNNNNNNNNNNNSQQGNNIFNNNNQQGNNIFNNNNSNAGNNIFNNNNQNNNNSFYQNNQGNYSNNNNNNNNNYNNSNNNNEEAFLFQDPLFNLNFNALNGDQQAYLIKSLSTDQIRRLIKHYISNLLDVKKLQGLTLTQQNSLSREKASRLATKLNIKNQIVYIKKEVRDNIVNPIKSIKAQNQQIAKTSQEIISKLSNNLLQSKQRLIEAINQQKLVKQLKAQLQQIDTQVQDFIKPLFSSFSNKNNNYSFIDPDPFCIKISQRILKHLTHLDNQIDQILAVEQDIPEESVSVVNTIEHLIEYYQNVASQLHQFTIHYNRVKKEALSKRSSNATAALQRISKKAKETVDAQLQAYKLINEIQDILQQRSISLRKDK